MKQSPAAFLQAMAETVIPDKLVPIDKDTLRQLNRVSKDCAKATGVQPNRMAAYSSYFIERVINEGLRRESVAFGVPTELIDKVMDIGPGRANLPFEAFTDAQADQLVKVLKSKRIDPDNLPDKAWTVIARYAVTATNLYGGLKSGRL